MELKFYLNKFLKVDGIENYSLGALEELRKVYDRFTDKTEGYDPDFPMMSVGGKEKKGKTIAVGKNNIYQNTKEGESIEDAKSRISLGFEDSRGFTLTK